MFLSSFFYIFIVQNKEIMKTKQFKLEKEFAQKWVDALRSGKYQQGESFLQTPEGAYCCLGVACRMDHPKVNLFKKFFIDSHGTSSGFISKNLEKNMPALLRGSDDTNEFVKLVSDMNDGGDSFNDIANWIEENVEFV